MTAAGTLGDSGYLENSGLLAGDILWQKPEATSISKDITLLETKCWDVEES